MQVTLVLLGVLCITAYRPIAEQTKPSCTDRHHCETSTGENVSELGLAVSQDLLKSGQVHYGDMIIVDGYAPRIVDDTMALKNHKAVDLLVYTRAEERSVGVKHRKVWVIKMKREDK